ncbi:hypothetical protein [Novosphingobium sp.]|uniref:hypothetical protein n=1 Tax=Novosphingobium sp. TaxID=1874826 RepID=UPI0033412E89
MALSLLVCDVPAPATPIFPKFMAVALNEQAVPSDAVTGKLDDAVAAITGAEITTDVARTIGRAIILTSCKTISRFFEGLYLPGSF